jgi:hypothetical protein
MARHVSTAGWLHSRGPPTTCDLQRPLNPPRTPAPMDADQACDRTGASPLSEVVPSCKTSEEGFDGHDVDEGPMRGVELLRGFPCGLLSTSQ